MGSESWVIPLIQSIFIIFLFGLNLFLGQWVHFKVSQWEERRFSSNSQRFGQFKRSFSNLIKILTRNYSLEKKTYGRMVLLGILSVLMSILPFSVLPYCDIFYLLPFKKNILFEIYQDQYSFLYFLGPYLLGQLTLVFFIPFWEKGLAQIEVAKTLSKTFYFQSLLILTLACTFYLYKVYDFHALSALQSGLNWGFIPNWGIFHYPQLALIFFLFLFIEGERGPFNFRKLWTLKGDSLIVMGPKLLAPYFFLIKASGFLTLKMMFVFLFLGGYNSFIPETFLEEMGFSFIPLLQTGSLIIKLISLEFLISLVFIKIPLQKFSTLLFWGRSILLPLVLLNFVLVISWNLIR